MDYRCPICATNLKRRKLAETVITKMEIDCAHCKATIRLNVHRAELAVVLLNFGVIVTLGALAYWLGSERLARVRDPGGDAGGAGAAAPRADVASIMAALQGHSPEFRPLDEARPG